MQMFLSLMENSIPCYLEIRMLMILNVMKVFQSLILSKEVDSINFKNAIIQSLLPFELPEFERDIEEMIIEEGFGNDYYGNLIIHNYPNLQSFETGDWSFSQTTSLSLSSRIFLFLFMQIFHL